MSTLGSIRKYHVPPTVTMTAESRSAPGSRTLLHAGAAGKAILAHLGEEHVGAVIDRGLEPLTDNTITDPVELREGLERVRERGYAIDWEEGVAGIRGIAVPIATDDLPYVGSIMTYGPTNRFPDERLQEELPDKLLQLKNVVKFNLDYP
jgi:DNA-binding IclR family transcriptional regulator